MKNKSPNARLQCRGFFRITKIINQAYTHFVKPRLNFPMIMGISFIIMGSIMMCYLFWGNYDSIEPRENISLVHSDTVLPTNILFNFDTTTNSEQMMIHYSLLRNASKPGFVALVIPYEGGFNIAFTGLEFHQFTPIKSLIFFKKFTSTNNTEMVNDQNNISLSLNGKIESYKFLSHHVEIPFASTPTNTDVLKFVNSLRPNGTSLSFGWNNVDSSAYVRITVLKNNDDISTQPSAATFYDTDVQGKTSYRSALWKITGDNPLYILDYSTSDNKFYLGFFQTLGSLFTGSGISMIILGIETKRNSDRQKRLETFIKTQRHLQDANQFFASGKYKESVTAHEKILELIPDDVSTLINLGASWDHLNEPEKTLLYCEKVLENDPTNRFALNNKGHALMKLGKYPEAVTEYNKILNVHPKDEYALINIGIVYLENLSDYNMAIKYFGKVLASNSKDVDALGNIAIALFEQTKYNLTIRCCDKALKIQPKNLQVLTAKGNALLKLEKYSEAKACYEIALKIEPLASITLLNMGNVLIGLNEYESGLRYLHEYLVTNPTDVPVLKLIRDVYHTLNDRNNEAYWNDKYNEALRRIR